MTQMLGIRGHGIPWHIAFVLLMATQPCHALKLTDFYEFQQRVAATPAKNMLETDADLPGSGCVESLPDRPLVLLDVVEQALCNNPKTMEMWATVRAQAAQVGVQRAAYLPKLTWISGVTRSHNMVDNSLNDRFAAAGFALNQDNHIYSRAHSLRLTWLVADFGQRHAKNNQAEALLDAANALHDAALQDVFINAAQAYFEHLSAQAMLLAYEDSERVAKESLAAATAKFKAGVGLLTDQLQAQTAYAQARLDRTKAEGELKNAHGALAMAMGVLANNRFTVQGRGGSMENTAFVSTVDEMIQQALDAHPSIIAAKAKLQASRENYKAVRSDGLPTLSLNAEVSKTDQLGQQQQVGLPASNIYTTNSSLGLQVNIPLFEGFARGYQLQSADAETQVRASDLNKATQQVTLDVWKSYHALLSERENVRATEELVANSHEAFKVAQGRYNAGVGNIIELLNAQNAWSNAKQQNIKSLSAWRTARLKLASSMGKVGLWAIAESGDTAVR